MADKLHYRLFRDEDLEGVLRLWEEASGWGPITAEQWRSWYLSTPYGPGLVAVAAESGGAVVGQMAFTPVLLDGPRGALRALRVSAPVLSHSVRAANIRSVSHPAIMLYWEGSLAAAAAGYELIYALPDPAWLAFFQRVPRFVISELPCLAAPLVSGPPDLLASPVGRFGAEHEALWRTARAAFAIDYGVERSAAWLNYKNSGHLAFDLRERDGTLAGYSAVKRQSGLLVDLVAHSPADLPRVLAATRDALARAAPPGLATLSAMANAALAPALDELGFIPVDYRFIFVYDAISPGLDTAALSAARWYILPGD